MIYGNIKLLTEELRMDYYYYELNLLLISEKLNFDLIEAIALYKLQDKKAQKIN